MINKTITLELQLTEEQATQLFDDYTYIDVKTNIGNYENFDDFLEQMLEFGALKHIRENIELAKRFTDLNIYNKQT